MIARFERDVCGGTLRIVPAAVRVAQRLGLGVRLTSAMVPAFADRDPVTDEDAADGRVRSSVRDGSGGELTRPREIRRVRVDGYGRTSTPFQNAT
jgi:hypothetical protein